MSQPLKKRLIATFSIIALAGALYVGSQQVSNILNGASASGINPTITPDNADVSVSTNIEIQFTTSSDLNSGQDIRLGYSSGYSGTLSTSNTTINGAAPSSVVSNTAGGVTATTITLGANIAANDTISIVTTGLTTPVTAGNYSFTLDTDAGDAGAVLQYVGQANVVSVRAFVPVFLSFNIRNDSDTANTNICDLGTTFVTSINSCSYRLKVATNATSGYIVTMVTDGGLSNGTYTMNDADQGPTGNTISAGNELYGVQVDPGSITGTSGSITASTPFTNTNGSNMVRFNEANETVLLVADRSNAPGVSGDTTNTSLVTHFLTTANDTPAGFYTQNITYKVAPSF